jgi:hypothetical protein
VTVRRRRGSLDGTGQASAGQVGGPGGLQRRPGTRLRVPAPKQWLIASATGRAEREVAAELLADAPRATRATVGADRGYDTRGFVAAVREQGVTPHVAQNVSSRSSAVDGRTTRHCSYQLSQRFRKAVEHPFGWLKQVAGIRQVKVRGLRKVDWVFTLGMAAFDLLRMGWLVRATT